MGGKDGEVKWVSSSEPPAASSRGTACGGCKSGRTTCCDLLPSALATRLRKMRKWIWEDLTKSHLIWIKLIFFFQSASLVVLYPYLVIHMRSLGLSTEEVAVVNGVIPAADMIGPPLAGFLADKIGNFRVFMSGLTFGTVQPDSWHCSSSLGSYMASPLSSSPPPLA